MGQSVCLDVKVSLVDSYVCDLGYQMELPGLPGWLSG